MNTPYIAMLTLLIAGCAKTSADCDATCPTGTNQVDVDFEGVISDGIFAVESTSSCLSFCEPVVQCRFPNVPVVTKTDFNCQVLEGYSTIPTNDEVDTSFADFWTGGGAEGRVNTITSGWQGIGFGDLDADGSGDLITLANGDLVSYFSTGNGGFSTPIASGLNTANAEYIAVGQFNADAFADVVVTAGNGTYELLFFAGDGSGQFAAPVQALADAPFDVLLAGDLDGDGLDDLVSGMSGGSVLYANIGGDFTLVPLPTGPWAGSFIDLLTLDANGDGRPDLATGESGGSVWFNQGSRVFGTPQSGADGTGDTVQITAIDADADGLEELGIWNATTASFDLYAADAGFSWLGALEAPSGGFLPLRGDMDGDGLFDSMSTNGAAILTNQGSPYVSVFAGAFGQEGAVIDIDGDGIDEGILANVNSGEITVVWP